MQIRSILIAAALVASLAPGVGAAGWGRYENGRYQYAIAIPPGFSSVTEAENGDGGVAMSEDGKAELRAWGSYITEQNFSAEIALRIDQDEADGWRISYDQRRANSASWSGTKANRILYARAVTGCDGAAIYFNLEYDRADLKAYDGIVARLVKSLKSAC